MQAKNWHLFRCFGCQLLTSLLIAVGYRNVWTTVNFWLVGNKWYMYCNDDIFIILYDDYYWCIVYTYKNIASFLLSVILCFSAQSKCNKLESSIEELESLLTETAARNEELQVQCDEEAKRCHAMEVAMELSMLLLDCSRLDSCLCIIIDIVHTGQV